MIPKNTTLQDFKEVHHWISQTILRTIAEQCLEFTFNSLYDLFIKFLTLAKSLISSCNYDWAVQNINWLVGVRNNAIYR